MAIDNELYDTFGEQYSAITQRLDALEKVTDGDLIVLPDGSTVTMGD